MYIPTWKGGTPAAIDLAITSPQRQAALQMASGEAGAAAKMYETHKRTFKDTEDVCSQQGMTFLPMVAESSGGWGPGGLKVLKTLAKKAAARDGLPASVHMGHYLEGLSVAIRRAAARAILRRTTTGVGSLPAAAATAAAIFSSWQ